jgi:hypothetical protein
MAWQGIKGMGDKHIPDAGTLALYSACMFYRYKNGGVGSVLTIGKGLNAYDYLSAGLVNRQKQNPVTPELKSWDAKDKRHRT